MNQNEYTHFINSSPSLTRYKDTLKRCMYMYYPRINPIDLDNALNYSIQKRFKDSNKVRITNSYKRYRNSEDEYVTPEQKTTLKYVADYIVSREPIITPHGVMFKHHTEVPNPLDDVIQSFLKLRSKYKAKMFEYPKGSEDFEKYNLSQALEKINANGCYGVLGMGTSLLYNVNVASSVTATGRAMVSTMTLHFESFLNNNVKFGSLNEVVQFIDNIRNECTIRKFDDRVVLEHWVSPEECFAKLILSTGYRWIPSEKEMDIIWRIVNNLSSIDRNRVYYKNNLFEFAKNPYVLNLVKKILHNMDQPMLTPDKVEPGVAEDLILLTDLMKEYVFYNYLFIDRIDRCDNMIKSVTMVSDTDSTIISLDGWYRFILENIKGESFKIANDVPHPALDEEPKELKEKVLDYDFDTDEIVEVERISNPTTIPANDSVKYSIVNLMIYILDKTVNTYMIKACENMNTQMSQYRTNCSIIAKSEFLN